MFEQVKELLMEQNKAQLSRFDELKQQIEELENKMQEDNSEENYTSDLKALNKKYGLFRNLKNNYKKDLEQLQNDYYEKLKNFKELYENYSDLRREAAKIDLYGIQKKLDQLKVAKSLEDLKMSEEDALKLIQNQG